MADTSTLVAELKQRWGTFTSQDFNAQLMKWQFAAHLVHREAVDLFDAHEAATFRTRDDKTAIDFRSLYKRLSEN